jgi:hypothetical protein
LFFMSEARIVYFCDLKISNPCKMWTCKRTCFVSLFLQKSQTHLSIFWNPHQLLELWPIFNLGA